MKGTKRFRKRALAIWHLHCKIFGTITKASMRGKMKRVDAYLALTSVYHEMIIKLRAENPTAPVVGMAETGNRALRGELALQLDNETKKRKHPTKNKARRGARDAAARGRAKRTARGKGAGADNIVAFRVSSRRVRRTAARPSLVEPDATPEGDAS